MAESQAANVVAIVQARTGSIRLPNKTMRILHGIPIIEWVYRRMKQLKHTDRLIFAIPESSRDDELAAFLNKLGAHVYRGSELDVLDRFYNAALKYNADLVVRICADSPLVSASEVDRLICFYQKSNCDYAYNHIPRCNNYPDGLGAEITSFEILKTIHQETIKKMHREHIFDSIWDQKDRFLIATFDPEDQRLFHPELKLDVDTLEDLDRLEGQKINIDMAPHEIIAALIDESA